MAKTNYLSESETNKNSSFVSKWNVGKEYGSMINSDPNRHRDLSNKQSVFNYYYSNKQKEPISGNGSRGVGGNNQSGWGPIFKDKNNFTEMHWC
ncbi:hypothetical protein NH340_JMT01753 [Sarcoptes scabiei]|nr:hypothetical protein NH340_JMT01753 [Sarcoptes scabiei]